MLKTIEGGIVQIDIVYDSDVNSAPVGFKACINAVAQYYDTLFTNDVTVTIEVGYGTVGGRALTSNALGSSLSRLSYADYGQVAAALTAQGAPGSTSLPSLAPSASRSLVATSAEAKALGLGNASGVDGSVGFSSTANWTYDTTQSGTISSSSYDFVGTAEHEFSEIMGRLSLLDQSTEYSIMDLFRYSGYGTRQLSNGAPSYFSIDGGATALNYFNNYVTGNSGDLGDWAQGSPDSYNDNDTRGALTPVTPVDKTVMAAIGWIPTANAANLTVAGAIPTLSAAAAVTALSSGQDAFVAVSDTGANIGAQLDQLNLDAANQNLAAINPTSGVTVTILQLRTDSHILSNLRQAGVSLILTDSAANIISSLPTLLQEQSAGQFSGIAIAGSGFSTVTEKSLTYNTYSENLATVTGNFYVLVDTSDNAFAAFTGLPTHGTVAEVAGPSAAYTLSANANGHTIDLDYAAGGYAFTDINAVQFSDRTIIVAQAPASDGTVTTGNVTELYGAVFGREPDVPGLAYYQDELKTIPALTLQNLATNFLQSPEYANNSAHAYAQTAPGEIQFINDGYTNLLHRAPEAGAVPFYLAIIAQYTQGLTPGTAAYTAADLAAHATVITDFSQSAEFLGDVQITAAHPADSQHWLFLT